MGSYWLCYGIGIGKEKEGLFIMLIIIYGMVYVKEFLMK